MTSTGAPARLHRLVEDTVFPELDCEIERRLTAERGEQRVGTLAPQHRGDAVEIERLDVGAISESRVGHDRRRVRVADDRPITLLAEHFFQRLTAA